MYETNDATSRDDSKTWSRHCRPYGAKQQINVAHAHLRNLS